MLHAGRWGTQGASSLPTNLGDRIVKSLQQRVTVLPFHREWLRAVFQPDIEIGVLSCPRGSAKTWLCGNLAAECLRPGSPLWQEGIEVLAVSGSLEQSRIILSFVRDALADVEDDYRIRDSSQRLSITHKKTNTRLRVLSSSARRAMGLSQFSIIFADEGAAWGEREGALMWAALTGSLGKREGQRILAIGTRAPADAHGWWCELLDAGNGPGIHVTALTAPDEAPWDSWGTLQKVNPLVRVNPSLRRTILRERNAARKNPTQRPWYEAYRLNRQVDISAEVLVTIADWRRVEARDVPPRKGRAVIGLDLGSERSWSAAWCAWRNGRTECYAVAPGIPDLAERERQDAMQRGLYRKLYEDGSLIVDEGLYVSRPQTLVDHLVNMGVVPEVVYCDTFEFGELKGAVNERWPLVKRRTRWSESTEDISAFRRFVKDGPMSIAPESAGLARLGISQATAFSDQQGSVHLQKKRHSRSRDDIAVAGTLAVGALARMEAVPQRRGRFALAG